MLKKNSIVCVSVAFLLLASTSAVHAASSDNNKVLRDTNGHVVRSIGFGNCVRTEWEAGKDACAPEPAPVPVAAPAPPPAPVAVTRTVVENDARTVYFEFDSAALTPESQQKLGSLAAVMKSAKDVKSALIVGYADRKGSDAYNQKLSMHRAEAVKAHLAQSGYMNTNIAEIRAVGESQPSATCEASQSRSQEIACLSPDRRVEVEIEYLDTKTVMQQAQ